MREYVDAVDFEKFIPIVILSLLGSVARTIQDCRDTKESVSWSKKLITLLGDCVISGFLGISCGYLLLSTSIPVYTTIGICGIVAHLGSRGVWIVQRILALYIAKKLDLPKDEVVAVFNQEESKPNNDEVKGNG